MLLMCAFVCVCVCVGVCVGVCVCVRAGGVRAHACVWVALHTRAVLNRALNNLYFAKHAVLKDPLQIGHSCSHR